MQDLAEVPHLWAESIQQRLIAGTPDILMCIKGFFIGLELKVDGNEPTALQKWKLQQIAKAGGMGIVANPGNWLDVLAMLKELAKGKKHDSSQLEDNSVRGHGPGFEQAGQQRGDAR